MSIARITYVGIAVLMILAIIGMLYYGSQNHVKKESYDEDEENKNVYICLTTIPERLVSNHFKNVIESLLHQTIAFNKIILNIPYHFKRTNEPYPDIPEWITTNSKIMVNRCEDKGPATKFLGSWSILDDDAIIMVGDDDIVYKPYTLQQLYETWLQHKQSVISHATKKRFEGYTEIQGFGGYLFQKQLLNGLDTYAMPSICQAVDDTWISSFIYNHHISVIKTEGDIWNSVDRPKSDEHPKWFELCKDPNKEKIIAQCLVETIRE